MWQCISQSIKESCSDMDHGHTMVPEPTCFEWKQYKDHVYVTLAVIPIAGILCYSNLVIGKVELIEIPEDYEPEHQGC